mmetsp:Transcript_16582/g.11898  ORF Transcript_16582/g.11898 Transcript_16582/m.11898 type:complete len:134 (+) Transcript_16582:196-597(+)
MQFTESKPRPEKMHLTAKESPVLEDIDIPGKRTYIDVHNRKSINEYKQEQVMGTKRRIVTMYEQRNGMPIASLGDKIYKSPEYLSNFYKEGGLIVGSTNKNQRSTVGNSKNIDFYAGLQLDKGPLNPGRKTWK